MPLLYFTLGSSNYHSGQLWTANVEGVSTDSDECASTHWPIRWRDGINARYGISKLRVNSPGTVSVLDLQFNTRGALTV